MRFDIMMVNVVFTMLGAILIILFSKLNYKNTTKIEVSFLFVTLFVIINSLLSTLFSRNGNGLLLTVKPIILMAISIILIRFILKLSFTKSIISFIVFTIGLAIGDAINPFIISFLFGPMTVIEIASYLPAYIISNISATITAASFMALIKGLEYLLSYIKNKRRLVGVFIFTFIILTANIGLKYFVKVYDEIAFLVILILTILYSIYLVLNITTLYKTELAKAEKEQQEFYNKSLEDTLSNVRRFRHDWNNHMTAVSSMISMGKTEEAQAYLNDIAQFNNVNNNTSYFNIKNAGLFGIIAAKKNRAMALGLDLDIMGSGEIKEIPKIKVSELCEVIGIFLDNAIEESIKTNEKVELKYSDTDNSIEISIKNKCESDIDLNQLGKLSSKGEGHGNGLKIVDQIIRKYKNINNYRSYENGTKTFEQLLVIEKGL